MKVLVISLLLIICFSGKILGIEIEESVLSTSELIREDDFLIDHYQRRSDEYGSNVHGILESVQVQQRYVIATIYNETVKKVSESSQMVAMGGGDCVNADNLGEMLQTNVLCIEPFMYVNTSALNRAQYLKIDAMRFTSLATIRYNFILFKEVIHHIPPTDYATLFRHIKVQLLKGGAMVIMSRPPVPYFLFSKFLKERWASTSANLDAVIDHISAAGFKVSTQSHNFTMSMNKSDWKKFVQDRTWSTFETLTDKEIENEFKVLDRTYPTTTSFNFTDNCIFIIATP